MQRVVGASLVASCEDVYAEVRALREILSDYSADTDQLVQSCQASAGKASVVAPPALVHAQIVPVACSHARCSSECSAKVGTKSVTSVDGLRMRW